jgi:molybdenum cofactor synthesis domain-containing protein
VKHKAAILIVSDSYHRGSREDLSGPRLRHCLEEAGYELTFTTAIPDDVAAITAALREAARMAQLIVTTGGTGISIRDVTPEATSQVCDRLLDGVAEVMRSEGTKQTPYAALSRGLCGTYGASLIVNLPGNPDGAVHSLKAVLHLVPHALDLLAGKTEHSGHHRGSV